MKPSGVRLVLLWVGVWPWVWVGIMGNALAGPGARMDYGPVLSYTVSPKPGLTNASEHLAVKGLVVQVEGTNAAACFDTETLRVAGMWRGGFVDLSQSHLDSYKGSDGVFPGGELDFATDMGPGWSDGAGAWVDPRAGSNGPLPKAWAHYRGFYRHGRRVVVAYRVGEREVLEEFGFDRRAGCFTRTFWIGPGSRALRAKMVSVGGSGPRSQEGSRRLDWREAKGNRWISLRGEVDRVELGWAGSGWGELRIPDSSEARVVQVCFWPERESSLNGESSMEPVRNPSEVRGGGPALWTEALETRGKIGNQDVAYEVDSLTVPEANPWNSWLRFVAHDFFQDGRAALSTWNGDVWILSGIEGNLERLVWRRHAAGLFDALGLRVVEGKVCVLGRDRITQLHDLNGDGEADYYENVNHDAPVTPSYHAFAMDLWTDASGNFYYTRCGQRADPAYPYGGALLKVSADGARLDAVAYGLRAANGMSLGPGGEITCSDNQGNWIPSGRLNWIEPGKFYGYRPAAPSGTVIQRSDPPLCWIPQTMDNSGGSQVWVTSDRWGPLGGQVLHVSYGKARLFLVAMETARGMRQGGVIPFPLRFETGIMRARFHPRDGQLYLSGLKGWQTDGPRDAAFHRVRYTGRPWRLPVAVWTDSTGVSMRFTEPLRPSSAVDSENYGVERWNYRESADYGSKDYSVERPGAVGRDRVEIRGVTVSQDGKVVRLALASQVPAMQFRVRFDLQFADGESVRSEYCGTINAVAE
ncbi:MAG: hypothetical protein FJ404_18740 [Verrucomicrobia bacterium]|nr:hypothetical protein [Verrucomicrobiota bacterium]